MTTEDMDNPWHIQSIYDLQYFNCPTCEFKDYSKQEFVNHAHDFHPTSIPFLVNIKDESLMDIIFPWDVKNIKTEPQVEINESTSQEFIFTYENKKILEPKTELVDVKQEVHEEKNKYKCDNCNKFFVGQNDLNIHIKTVHKGKKRSQI